MNVQDELQAKLEANLVGKEAPPETTQPAMPEMPNAINTDMPNIEDTKDPLWYLKFEGVNAEASNEELGIKQIVVHDKTTAKQREKNILCKVTMRTLGCTISGITVFCKRLPEAVDGHMYSLSVANPSRWVDATDNRKAGYQSDTFLTAAARAQIACHIQARIE